MKTSHIHRRIGRSLALVLCLAAAAGAGAPASAQAPGTAPVPDPAIEASRLAFEALPEADRRAIQDGLVWTGDYKGIVDGTFGRGTRAAIVAYAQRTGLPADGSLDQRGRAMLAAAAAQARNAVGFASVRDPKTGASAGLPTKLLPRRVDAGDGSRWASADGKMVFETVLLAGTAADLPALFDRLKTTTSDRKVTYRLLRPDFLVVSGEAGKSIFYTRIAAPPPDRPGALRGYTLTYAAGNKSFEMLSIAIANAWQPVPAAAAPAAGAGVNGVAPAPAAPPPKPAGPVLAATALAVEADKLLTVMATCLDPRVGSRPATVLKRDDASGLTLLQVPGLNARPLLVEASASGTGDAVVAIFLQRKGGGSDAEPAVAPGDLLGPIGAGPGLRLLAPLQAEGQGAPVLDRNGRFVGLAGRLGMVRRVAGIVPQQAWPLITAASFSAVWKMAAPQPSSQPGPERSAASLAAAVRPSLYPLLCAS